MHADKLQVVCKFLQLSTLQEIQHFPQSIITYNMILTFESVDEILISGHSNESYWAVLSCVAVCYAVKVVLTFESAEELPKCDHSNVSYWVVLSYANGTV